MTKDVMLHINKHMQSLRKPAEANADQRGVKAIEIVSSLFLLVPSNAYLYANLQLLQADRGVRFRRVEKETKNREKPPLLHLLHLLHHVLSSVLAVRTLLLFLSPVRSTYSCSLAREYTKSIAFHKPIGAGFQASVGR